MVRNSRFGAAIGLTMVVMLVFSATALFAQNSVTLGNAVVAGDQNTACSQQAQQFLQTGDLTQASQELQFTDPFFNTPVAAAQAQTSLGNLFRQGMFEQASIDALSYVASDNIVAAELMFTGMPSVDIQTMAQQQFMMDQQSMGQQQGQQQGQAGTTTDQAGQTGQAGTTTDQAGQTGQAGTTTDQAGQTGQIGGGDATTNQAAGASAGAQTGQGAQAGQMALPVGAFFHCENDQVTRVHLYFDRQAFMGQLGYGAGMQQGMGQQQGQTGQAGTTTDQAGQTGQAQTGQAGTCTVISADANVNLRQGPSTDGAEMGILNAGQTAQIVGQTTGADGMIWWQTAEGAWIRSDVMTTQEGDCAAVPSVQAQ